MLSLTIAGDSLREAVAWTARLVPGRPQAPVLAAIRLETGEDSLGFAAYDFNNAGTTSASALVLAPGRVLVSGRLLGAIAKTLDPAKDVTLTDEGGTLAMSVGRNRWELPTMPIEDYPQLPTMGETAAKLDAAEFRRALTRVLPAADRSGVAPLNGAVALVSAGQRLTLVATDRWRLAVAEIDWQPVDGAPEVDVRVPTAFLESAIHVLASDASAAEFGTTSGAVYLSGGSRTLTGRLAAAQWPAWRGLLPPVTQPVEVIFEVAELERALDRVLAVSDDERAVRFAMAVEGFSLETFDAKGSANAQAPIVQFFGEDKELAVKPKYLKDALATMESDRAILRTATRAAGRLDLVPIGEDGEPVGDYRHIVMPMDINKLLRR